MGDKVETGIGEDIQERFKMPKVVMCLAFVHLFTTITVYMRSSVWMRFLSEVLRYKMYEIKILWHTTSLFPSIVSPFAAVLVDCYLGYFYAYIATEWISTPILACTTFITVYYDSLPTYQLLWAIFCLAPVLTSISNAASWPMIGEQFKLPQMAKQLTNYLYFSYWLHNISVVIGQFAGPHLRTSVQCFGRPDCYFLPFSIAVGGTFVAYLTVVLTSKWWIKPPPPKRLIIFDVVKLSIHALKRKMKSRQPKEHWLDHGNDKFSQEFIDDVKRLKILVLAFPRMILLACSSQEYTTWIFQAKSLNGDFGFYKMQSDQISIFNSLLCVIFAPIFTYLLYPVLERKNLFVSKLQRMGVGYWFYVIAWAMATGLCYYVESKDMPLFQNGVAQFRIFNNNNASITISSEFREEDIVIERMDFYKDYNLKIEDTESFKVNYSGALNGTADVDLPGAKMTTLYFNLGKLESFTGSDENHNKFPMVRTVFNLKQNKSIEYRYEHKNVKVLEGTSLDPIAAEDLNPEGTYAFFIDDEYTEDFTFISGGVYVVFVNEDDSGKYSIEYLELHPPNSVHIMWMFPQFFTSVIGEILTSLSYNELIYTQSPVTMKASVAAGSGLIASLSNVLIAVIDGILQTDRVAPVTLVYTIVLIFGVFLYMYLAYKYKTVVALNKAGEMDLETPSDKKKKKMDHAARESLESH